MKVNTVIVGAGEGNFAPSVSCALLPLGSAYAADAANLRKVRFAGLHPWKILHDVRMAGSVTLHCSARE